MKEVTLDYENKIKVIETIPFNGTIFEICELDELTATSPEMAMSLYFAKQQGLKIHFVRVRLNNTGIKTEAGALYYFYGNIQCKTAVNGIGGFLKKTIAGSITGESALKPSYFGNGSIYLEPSYKHYLSITLENNSIIVDKGMFYCCSSTVDIKPVMQRNISSATLGQEGIFQIELSGNGVVILESSVPASEIEQFFLNPGEELKVDGNFAILRSKSVDFSVTTSEKSLFGTAMNGEGFLNTFRSNSSGFVWLAPTAPIYKKLEAGISLSNKSKNNFQ